MQSTGSLLGIAAVVVVMAGAGAAGAPSRPLEVRVGPEVSMAPATVRITAFVEPNSANRALVVEVDSGEHFSSSEVPLQGADAPRSHSFNLKGLPAGTYEVFVRVRQEQRDTNVARRSFAVVAGRPTE